MTTFSQGQIVWPEAGPHSSHSAASHSDRIDPDGSNASGRARAREYAPDSAQSQPDGADGSEFAASATDGDWWGGLLGFVTPPDVWSTDRPSLSKAWAYAARGEWTREDGLPRRAGQAYAFAAVPVIGLLYLLAWVVERPARLAAAALLVVLLAQFVPVSFI